MCVIAGGLQKITWHPLVCQSVNLICKQTDWEKLRETRDVCARVLWLVLWFVAWQCDIQYRALTVSWGLERLRLLQHPDTYATLYRVELKAYLEQLVKRHIFSCALFLWQRQHVFLSSLFLVFILCPVSAYVTCCSFHFFRPCENSRYRYSSNKHYIVCWAYMYHRHFR